MPEHLANMWNDLDDGEELGRKETRMEAVLGMMIGMCRFHWLSRVRRSNLYKNTTEAVHKMDEMSRRIFPGIFTILNVIYWTAYLYW